MAGERKLGAGGEDSDPRRVCRIHSREDECRLRDVHLLGDPLHHIAGNAFSIKHDRQLIAGERPVGEHVDDMNLVSLLDGAACAHLGMIMQVLVPWARSLQVFSAKSLPSEVATLPPRYTTTASQRTGPVSAVIGRTKLTLVSRLVYRSPTERVVWTAQPKAESRIVIANPPCTTPIGL